jgi:protein phosphatase
MRHVLRSALRSITGPHRASNQDSAASAPGFAFVADGVGGHAGGDVASRVVTHVMLDALTDRDAADMDDDELRALLGEANAALAEQARHDSRLVGLATTFTGIFCDDDAVRVAHIGDSRAYLVRNGLGSRITHDDSYVQLLVDTGVLDPEGAWQHPQRNLLTQVLAGTVEDATRIHLVRQDSRPGDRWLLCSDGLTDYVDEPRVLELLVAAADPGQAADRLIAAALANDARDNITVAVCDVTGVDGLTADAPSVAGSAGLTAGAEPAARARPVPQPDLL